MFAHRQSQEFANQYRNHLQKQYPQPVPGDLRKKIQNYSFLITDKIGKGYSSVVYKGINDLTGQLVAIKVIQLKSLRDETSKFMLQTQIECFKQIRHPNLLRYENSFFTINNCYIITQFCSRGDLARMIKQSGGIDQQDASRMFLQIFKGYQHFSSAGFIHRDIKPANIFLADDKLKIADFGFCKRRSLIEKQNYNVGTPIYMPKESLVANIYNEKTDVWALGITLYEMIFGSVPFRGKTQSQLKVQIQRGKLIFPDQKPISDDLKDFISSCLQNDSFKRISIRDMHKHPWIQRLEKRLTSQPSRVYQKILAPLENILKIQQEQKQVRISLPNDGVSHNKSKDYFQKLPTNGDNRRSISSMQKLKLCNPKKNSQTLSIPRQSHINRSVGSINLIPSAFKDEESLSKVPETYNNLNSRQSSSNKENKPFNRPSLTISTFPSTVNLRVRIQQQKNQKQNIQKQNKRVKACIQKIVSLINYFRLLYKIAEKTLQASQEIFDSQIKTQLSQLHNITINDLKKNLSLHLECLKTKGNYFGLNQQFWTEFTKCQRWQMYAFVIKRYQNKYESILKTVSTKNSDSFVWKNYFIDFYSKIKQLEGIKILLVKERYAICELAYYLQMLVEMDQYAAEQGWEDFTEKYSNNQEFVSDGFTINMGNYYEVEEKVRTKFISMKKKKIDIY